jgi:branched-chain amino acid transport system ATP-binding protein
MSTSVVTLHDYEHTAMTVVERHALLDVTKLTKNFGGIRALNEVTFYLEERGIVSMIGPNGAGKTTLINVVTGIYLPDSGEIHFRGENIAGLSAHSIAFKGVSRTFQLEELFGSMTVLENAMVGCHRRSRSGIFRCGLRMASSRVEEKWIRDEARETLAMVGLEHKASHSISSLPLGERKLAGIARALCMKPKLLLLDEPVGGLAAHEIEKFLALIQSLLKEGLSIFIIEHNMPFVMSISERVIVLDQGSKIAEGSPKEVRMNERVIKAYLGEEVF